MFKVWDKVLYKTDTAGMWDIYSLNEYYIMYIDTNWRLVIWNNMDEDQGWRRVKEWDIKLIERKKEVEHKYNIIIKI